MKNQLYSSDVKAFQPHGSKCNLPMFDLLSDQEIAFLEKGMIIVNFKEGETIKKQGTFMSHVISVNSGLVKFYLEGRNQHPTILRLIKPGSFIGGPGMYLDQVHHFSLSAIKDTTICFMEMDAFKKVIFDNRAFGEEFLKDFSRDILHVYQRLIDLTQKQIPGRMADTLLYLFEDVFKSDKIDFRLTRQDLADLAGISKDSCIKILREFQEKGLIHYNFHGMDMLNLQELKRISQVG